MVFYFYELSMHISPLKVFLYFLKSLFQYLLSVIKPDLFAAYRRVWVWGRLHRLRLWPRGGSSAGLHQSPNPGHVWPQWSALSGYTGVRRLLHCVWGPDLPGSTCSGKKTFVLFTLQGKLTFCWIILVIIEKSRILITFLVILKRKWQFLITLFLI